MGEPTQAQGFGVSQVLFLRPEALGFFFGKMTGSCLCWAVCSVPMMFELSSGFLGVPCGSLELLGNWSVGPDDV